MIEIIVGVWLTSFLLSMMVVAFNYYITRQRLQSARLQTLNFNLAKVDMYWSNTLANFSALTPNAIDADYKKTLRNTLLLGFLGFASLLGLVLLIVIVASLHTLARSRKEVSTFRSELGSEKNLSVSEVHHLVRELTQIL